MEMIRINSAPAVQTSRRGQVHTPRPAVARGIDDQALTGMARTKTWASVGRGPVVRQAIARWLRRALDDSLRGWALAAGAPPHMFDCLAGDDPIAAVRAIDD